MDGSAERLSVRTSDFDRGVASLRSVFGDVDLAPPEDRAPDFVLRSTRTPALTATRWSISGVAGGRRAESDCAEPAFLTGVRVGGGLRMWWRWDDIDTDRPFLYPDAIDSALQDPDIANLAIARAAVDERARAITGRDDFEVRFTGTAPIDPAMDAVWRSTAAYAARMTETLPATEDAALAQAAVVDLVATVLLRVFPNTTLDAANRRDIGGPRGAALRRALRHIDEHLDAELTVVDIAAAARLSPRGLYAAFRRDLDTTPMHHVRSVRLVAARDALRSASPLETTVEAVALRYGFPDAGRFARRYAAVFDETPVETLQR
ncbi:helix-turn-helix domain-containing protein [Amnibacterium setariae]|uniref:AraC family transcriptional regulator n=1 Tax=Amnibacterium setariae TaxID=2306585 RepID=A0A3A1UCF0_9MICO|nr:AraC family transcriptional regulator [Amnibacterium setariae]RIX30856.1 AraC family transcriptional regulator [Amnibacterium setariae]